jgi:hypothetical protein
LLVGRQDVEEEGGRSHLSPFAFLLNIKIHISLTCLRKDFKGPGQKLIWRLVQLFIYRFIYVRVYIVS